MQLLTNVAMQVAIFCFCLWFFFGGGGGGVGVFSPPLTTNFRSAKSRNSIYFGGNTRSKQSQLATQHLLRDQFQENVARITWLSVCLNKAKQFASMMLVVFSRRKKCHCKILLQRSRTPTYIY